MLGIHAFVFSKSVAYAAGTPRLVAMVEELGLWGGDN